MSDSMDCSVGVDAWVRIVGAPHCGGVIEMWDGNRWVEIAVGEYALMVSSAAAIRRCLNRLQSLVESLAARVAGQAELLAAKAERKAVP